MNFLDREFFNFHSNKSIEERAAIFNRHGRIFDMIFSQQFNRPTLERLFEITNALRHISKSKEGCDFLKGLLSHKKAMLYFAQPSSRTFLSFQNACHILGMATSEIRDTSVSSEVKGESFDDGLRTFSSYADLIIMRHKQANSAERAAWLLNSYSKRPVPILNGGAGSDQHPTQALLDIYTLHKSFEKSGGIDGKTVLFCGDLKRGRTVRSLAYLLKNFENIKMIFAAPKFFQMNEDVLQFLENHNMPYTIETESLKNVLGQADAIYMTRIQDEHDTATGESACVDIEQFKLKIADMNFVKPNAAIMHPFPRRDEIDVEIDSDPRAKYWRQERNGMWTRAALIAYVFEVENKILNHTTT
ncbi:MAG TPA: hypothetical protein VI754_09525 [Bacteriovoracaceae bacterium]|nr:hypothetical protein [Bacteriovoracaceae bacterium]